MGNMIAAVVGLLLALYGAADLIVRICYRVLFGRRTARGRLLLHARGKDAEYQIRRLAVWRYLVPDGGFDWVVVLSDTDSACQKLCDELGFATVTEKEWMGMHESSLQSETDGV